MGTKPKVNTAKQAVVEPKNPGDKEKILKPTREKKIDYLNIDR